MPLDLERVIHAAARAALEEVFTPPAEQADSPRRESSRKRRRLGPVRAVAFGAALVTAGRLALRSNLRHALGAQVRERLHLDELLTELQDEDAGDQDVDAESVDEETELEPEDREDQESEDQEEPESDEDSETDEEQPRSSSGRRRAASGAGRRAARQRG